MRNRILLAAALLILAIVTVAGRSQRQQYEYKAEYYGTVSEKKLNELGAQGWELVSTTAEIKNGDTVITSFYFKRPK